MKKHTKILSLLLAIIMIVAAMPMTVCALDIVDSGTCGANLTWTLDTEGTLTISGSGAMYDYTFEQSPFYYNSNIKSVIMEKGVTNIGNHIFYDCYNLTSVTIPNSITTIGTAAFAFCRSLKSITLPNSITTIGKAAFHACNNLTSITIPDSVTTICDEAFYGCYSLSNVTIPDKVTIIGDYTFYFCTSLSSIIIPDNVTSIGVGAFYSCESLKSIIIPNSVITIGNSAFISCDNLTDVYYTGTEKQWNEINIGIHHNEALANATIHFDYHFHTYKAVITTPTCSEKGFTTYVCECGDSYTSDYVDVTDHNDANSDYICDGCGEDLLYEDSDDSDNCSHMCHKSGFVGFFWKIINFLQRIFGTGKYCECGAAHY